jgi:hypothetical protein
MEKMKNFKRNVVPFIIAAAVLLVLFWLLPAPVNAQSTSFWLHLLPVAVFLNAVFKQDAVDGVNDIGNYLIAVTLGTAAAILVVAFVCSNLFYSREAANRIYSNGAAAATTGSIRETSLEDFSSTDQFDTGNANINDRDTVTRIGDRVMGQLPEMVSQFEISDQYTQILYKGKLVRVTPLEYGGFIKWMNNKSAGVPGYIIVDSTTGEAKLVKLDSGMKYLPSAYFGQDLARHVQSQYPRSILGDSVFEIDENGDPYWITAVYSVKGISERKTVKGDILTNAVTGESEYYALNSVPDWVDHVIPAGTILSELSDNGKYQNGFWNSIFGQKGVFNTTFEYANKDFYGYNYVVCNGGKDVCLYTGITGTEKNESNVGFVYVSLKTGSVAFYETAVAEESSAESAAEGLVQEKGYTATFPVMVNIDGKPVYFMSLKDNGGLVKMYALCDAADYQKVVTVSVSAGLDELQNEYRAAEGSVTTDRSVGSEIYAEVTGVLEDMKDAVIDGNTYFYLKVNGSIYTAKAGLSDEIPFLQAGQTVAFTADGSGHVTKLN